MTNSGDNGTPVGFGRFDEYRRATDRRLDTIEHRMDEEGQAAAVTEKSRRDRTWLIGLTLASGIVFPILVTALITFLHLRG